MFDFLLVCVCVSYLCSLALLCVQVFVCFCVYVWLDVCRLVGRCGGSPDTSARRPKDEDVVGSGC